MKTIGLLNSCLLYFLMFVLVISFTEQYYFGNELCSLCVLQRFFMVAVGVSLTFNITWKLHFKHIGLGILGCILGSVIALYQWSILLENDGISHAPKIFSLPMYIWSAMVFFFVSLFLFVLLFSMKPEQKIHNNLFSTIAFGSFFLIAVIACVSTFISCGYNLC